ncbi:MAG: hypothetical protein AAF772_16730 [Acidobacteriota bacterium]
MHAFDLGKDRYREERQRVVRIAKQHDPDWLLQQDRYHTEPFCIVFLLWLEEQLVTAPNAVAAWVAIAPALAGRVYRRTIPPTTLPRLELRAHAVVGAWQRARGRLDDAQRAYARGLALLDAVGADAVPPVDRSEFHRRYALLQAFRGQADEGWSHLDQAEALARAHGTPSDVGCCLYMRGLFLVSCAQQPCAGRREGGVQIAPARAIALFSEALDHLDKRQHRAVHRASVTNLIIATALASTPGEFADALARIDAVRKQQAASRKSLSLPAVKLDWTRGLLLARLGRHHRAVRALRACQERFLRLEAPVEYLNVCLDLSLVFDARGDAHALRRLAADAAPVVAQHRQAHPEAADLLQRWLHDAAAARVVPDTLRALIDQLQTAPRLSPVAA